MKETDYIVIQAPMVTQLKLSGNSLLIFALIHGFSKDGEHSFTGSLDYICKWTNISKTSVISNLKQLVEKGFISKQERIENGVKFCSYRTNYGDLTPCKESSMVVKKLKQGSQETLMGGSQESLPNNNSKDKNRDNNSKGNTLTLPFSSPKFEELWNELRTMPKWKKKTANALQMNLNKLGRFDEQFAIELMENAIAGDYQGVVFQDTERRYEEWKAKKDGRFQTGYRQEKPKEEKSNFRYMMDMLNEINGVKEDNIDEQ